MGTEATNPQFLMHFWGQRHFVTHRKIRVREFLRQLNVSLARGISWNFGALVNTTFL